MEPSISSPQRSLDCSFQSHGEQGGLEDMHLAWGYSRAIADGHWWQNIEPMADMWGAGMVRMPMIAESYAFFTVKTSFPGILSQSCELISMGSFSLPKVTTHCWQSSKWTRMPRRPAQRPFPFSAAHLPTAHQTSGTTTLFIAQKHRH